MPAAHRSVVSLASVPIVMLFAIVSANRNDSWNTSATLARSVVARDFGEVDAADAHRHPCRAGRAPRAARTASSCRSRSGRRARPPRRARCGRRSPAAPARRRRIRTRAPSARRRAARPGSACGSRRHRFRRRPRAPGRCDRGRRPNAASPRAGSPTTRIGKASSVNRAIACTSSPGETAPVDTRQPPTASSAMMARFGSASRVGSKSARSAPTRTRATRSCVGGAGQPLHLGVLAPERLHDQRAFEALVRDRRHVADPLLHRLRGQLDAPGVEAVQREHRREQHETDQGEQRIDREERDEREDDQQHEAGRERQRVDHLRRDHHVVVGVGEQGSGRVLAVERQAARRGSGRRSGGAASPCWPRPSCPRSTAG